MPAPTLHTHRILVVDPEEDFLDWVSRHLHAPDTEIHGVTNAESALAWAKEHRPSLILTELILKPFSGLDLLRKLRLDDPNALVILTSGSPPTSALIEAMKLGGHDFLRKSALSYDLRPAVESALRAKEALLEQDKRHPPLEADVGETVIGRSAAMQEVFKLIGRVSRSEAPVLITGESGCGKEVVARAVHKFSARSAREFVAINCAAIPENLLESELFGHEKGAFTGAMQQRVGRFEQCDGGTLFLDEVGEMPILVQSKLLRVLQEKEFSRVGGNQTMRSNVRIIAATNRPPEKAIEAGVFREDLFYRLNVVRIHIPPLRDRREDIRPLAEFFLDNICRENPSRPRHFSQAASDKLLAYNWPGNVRELENIVHRAAILATGSILMPDDLPLGTESSTSLPDTSKTVPSSEPPHKENAELSETIGRLLDEAENGGPGVLRRLEDFAIHLALSRTNSNRTKAAGLLGISKAALSRKLNAKTVH